MSRPKKKQDKPKQSPPDDMPAGKPVESKPESPAEDRTERTERTIPKHRRCRLCWGRDKGVGFSENSKSTAINIAGKEQIATTRTIRSYKCDVCSFDWKIKVIKQTFPLDHCEIDVENREVQIETRVRD